MEFLITWVSPEGGNRRESTFVRSWAEKVVGQLMDEGTQFTFQTIDHRK